MDLISKRKYGSLSSTLNKAQPKESFIDSINNHSIRYISSILSINCRIIEPMIAFIEKGKIEEREEKYVIICEIRVFGIDYFITLERKSLPILVLICKLYCHLLSLFFSCSRILLHANAYPFVYVLLVLIYPQGILSLHNSIFVYFIKPKNIISAEFRSNA